jgi:hypothetical protein
MNEPWSVVDKDVQRKWMDRDVTLQGLKKGRLRRECYETMESRWGRTSEMFPTTRNRDGIEALNREPWCALTLHNFVISILRLSIERDIKF